MKLCVWAERSYYTNSNSALWRTPAYSAQGNAPDAFTGVPQPGFNPAVLDSGENHFFAGYNNYYRNSLSAAMTALSLPVDSVQRIGISLSYLFVPGVDSVSAQTDEDGVPYEHEIHRVTASEIYLNCAYGRTVFANEFLSLAAGGAFHVNRRRLVEWTGYGIGLDAGLLLNMWNTLSVSALVNDITTKYMHWSSTYQEQGLPRGYLGLGYRDMLSDEFRLSLSYRSPELFGNSGYGVNTFTTKSLFDSNTGDLSPVDSPELLFQAASYGVELAYRAAAFRAGYSNTNSFSFGAGVQLFEAVGVDFAYVTSRSLGGSYTLSTSYRW
ncbi:MAG: hypothetical protein ACQEQV_01585 [Fibrobacterota bacterium]